MRPEFHSLRVASLQHEGQAVIVGLEVPPALREAFAFRAGQYLTLRAMQGGVELRRPYSICSAKGDAGLRVGIRQVANGAFSSGIAPRLRVGDTLEVLMPQGRFVLPTPQGPRHVLGIAAGSGITPVLSILATALRHEPGTRCTLILGNRQFESVMLRNELDALKDRYLARFAVHHVFSRGPRDDALPSDTRDALFYGRLDAQRLTALVRAVAPLTDGDEAVVCGPSGVIAAAQTALASTGLSADHIHIERFGSDESPSAAAARAKSVEALPNSAEASAAPTATPAPRAQVTVIMDGLRREIRFQSTDTSILQAGRRSGLDMPYACQSGVCSTCKAQVLEGDVRMQRNQALTPAEVAQGFVLCCQAEPVSTCVTLTLDAR